MIGSSRNKKQKQKYIVNDPSISHPEDTDEHL